MRYHLEPPLSIQTHQIVVISRIQTHHRRLCSTDVFQGKKAPAYFLLKTGSEIEVLDASGAKVPLEDVETACPEIAATAFGILKLN